MGFIDDLQLINLSTPNSGNGDTAYVGGGKLNGNITAIATEIDAIRLQLDNINTVKNISFLGINPDFSKRAKAFTAINALPAFSVSSIESVGFSRVYSTGIDGDVPGGGTSVGFVREWYYLKGKGKGNYGTGGVQLTASDIIVGHVEAITAGVIDLGDIGINEIWDFVNDNGPYVVAGTTEFRAEQDSEDKKWVFIGDDGTYGDGELEVTAANFLEITEEPEPDFGLFITKDSKQYRSVTITDTDPSQLYLTPERTTFLIKVTAGSGEINGFVDIASEIAGAITYDGMDVFIKNDSIPDVILKHNHGTAPLKFWFKSEEDFVLKQNEIVHLKVNNADGIVEMVGFSKIDVTTPTLQEVTTEGRVTTDVVRFAGNKIIFDGESDTGNTRAEIENGNPRRLYFRTQKTFGEEYMSFYKATSGGGGGMEFKYGQTVRLHFANYDYAASGISVVQIPKANGFIPVTINGKQADINGVLTLVPEDIGVEVTTFTGNELPLTNPLGRKQTATPNTSATFTIGANPVLGGNVKVLINRATEPTLPATTLGISGLSGTANINIGGDDYLVTFDTNLITTAANFVTDHAAAILADHGLTVTSLVNALLFVGGKRVNGITNATGDLSGLITVDIRKRLGSDFQADTDMYLVVEQEDGFIEYQFQEIVL